jgi:hypothetical protein
MTLGTTRRFAHFVFVGSLILAESLHASHQHPIPCPIENSCCHHSLVFYCATGRILRMSAALLASFDQGTVATNFVTVIERVIPIFSSRQLV